MKKWSIKKTKEMLNNNFFKVIQKECYHSGKKINHNFYIFEFVNWVNIIPITKDREIILVKQQRLGINEFTLEIPAGILDSETEDPLEAAKRELVEETGYTSENFKLLSKIAVNPAIQNNYCYFYLAENVEKTKEINLDPTEDIEIKILEVDKALKMLLEGKLNNSITALGLLLAFNGINLK